MPGDWSPMLFVEGCWGSSLSSSVKSAGVFCDQVPAQRREAFSRETINFLGHPFTYALGWLWEQQPIPCCVEVPPLVRSRAMALPIPRPWYRPPPGRRGLFANEAERAWQGPKADASPMDQPETSWHMDSPSVKHHFLQQLVLWQKHVLLTLVCVGCFFVSLFIVKAVRRDCNLNI